LKVEGVKLDKNRGNMLKKFIELRDKLTKNDIDYIIMDMASGIKYWVINSLAISDVLLLVLRMQEIDIGGARIIANEILNAYKEPRSIRYHLVLYMLPAYCIPDSQLEELVLSNTELNCSTLLPSGDDLIRNTMNKKIMKEKFQFHVIVIFSLLRENF
jgi:cellulose biosynthesis protein BcsQ